MKMIYFLVNKIEILGNIFINIIINIGEAGILLTDVLFANILNKKNYKYFIRNIYFIGVLSLGIIILSAFFIGMVVGFQGYYILKDFGKEEIIGQMSTLIIIRELAPVISALLFTGRTGTSLTTEICLMKNTDQLSSIDMMGIDSIKKIITPRFWAGMLSMFILSIVFIVIAVFGCYFSTVFLLEIDTNVFWINIKENIDFKLDVINSLIKSIIFSFIIVWISIYQGIKSKSTMESIALSTTNTVVYSSFVILSLNYFLTSIMF